MGELKGQPSVGFIAGAAFSLSWELEAEGMGCVWPGPLPGTHWAGVCVCGGGWGLGFGSRGFPGVQKNPAYSAFIREALWMAQFPLRSSQSLGKVGSSGAAEAHGGLQEVTRPKLTGPTSGPSEGTQWGEGSR